MTNQNETSAASGGTAKKPSRIAMTPDELDAFLGEQRVCRLATVDGRGRPHVAPVWFVWHGGAVWILSLTRSQRWTNAVRSGEGALVADDGQSYGDLRGAELRGKMTVVGEIPRVGEPNDELAPVEQLFARKYQRRDDLVHDKRHGWLKLTPEHVASWDFTKMGRKPEKTEDSSS